MEGGKPDARIYDTGDDGGDRPDAPSRDVLPEDVFPVRADTYIREGGV